MTEETAVAPNTNTSSIDTFVPKVVTDFIFDLYDSVTLSQIHIEQMKLYTITYNELCNLYYTSTTWPSPANIALECNGDPLFLAIYRELTHRYYFNTITNGRPTLTDRIIGWNVYKELFDEILDIENHNTNYYLIPIWVFEILFEFIYQYQGYCQIKSAVYTTAKKNGFIDEYGNHTSLLDNISTKSVTTTTTTSTTDGTSTTGTTDTTDPSTSTTNTTNTPISTKHINLIENLHILENNIDAWDIGIVFTYLHRFIQIGFPPTTSQSSTSTSTSSQQPLPVNMYFAIYSCICQSRLECLLGDYTACLLSLDKFANTNNNVITTITKDNETFTIIDIINSVIAARVSLVYHVGIAFIQLRRYYDAYNIIIDCIIVLHNGFKNNTIRHDLFNKQYERLISLLIILIQICPGMINIDTQQQSITQNSNNNNNTDESVIRVLREKLIASKIDTVTTTNYDEFFASPKFINHNPLYGGSLYHKQQIDLFNDTMKFYIHHGNTLRSYLKLYTSISIMKLANFHDISSIDDFIPILITYKSRMRQLQRTYINPTFVTSGSTSTSDLSSLSLLASSYSHGTYPGRSSENNNNNDTNNNNTNTTSSTGSSMNNNNNTYQLDLHYYIMNDTLIINEAEQQRHIESYLYQQIKQAQTIYKNILKLPTKII